MWSFVWFLVSALRYLFLKPGSSLSLSFRLPKISLWCWISSMSSRESGSTSSASFSRSFGLLSFASLSPFCLPFFFLASFSFFFSLALG